MHVWNSASKNMDKNSDRKNREASSNMFEVLLDLDLECLVVEISNSKPLNAANLE